jgi:anti-sigma B factor antagonist
MTFAVHRETDAAGVTLVVVGDVDMDTAPQLVAAVAALDSSSGLDLVIDLSQVDFLDSSGLGALVGAQKSVAQSGGHLTVVCDKPQLLNLFRITRLHNVLTVVPTARRSSDSSR